MEKTSSNNEYETLSFDGSLGEITMIGTEGNFYVPLETLQKFIEIAKQILSDPEARVDRKMYYSVVGIHSKDYDNLYRLMVEEGYIEKDFWNEAEDLGVVEEENANVR